MQSLRVKTENSWSSRSTRLACLRKDPFGGSRAARPSVHRLVVAARAIERSCIEWGCESKERTERGTLTNAALWKVGRSLCAGSTRRAQGLQMPSHPRDQSSRQRRVRLEHDLLIGRRPPACAICSTNRKRLQTMSQDNRQRPEEPATATRGGCGLNCSTCMARQNAV